MINFSAKPSSKDWSPLDPRLSTSSTFVISNFKLDSIPCKNGLGMQNSGCYIIHPVSNESFSVNMCEDKL